MLNNYINKKILILGAGLEGRATFNYLEAHGLSADIADRQSQDVFFEINPELRGKKFEYHSGDDYLKKIFDYEVVFRTPGISPLIEEILEAKNKGVEITSQIEFFMKACPAKIIGVTGTKGKGTTATLIYEILKNGGKKVFLGGNVGLPAISFLDQLDENSIVILELSSFQLMDLKASPNVAVVLNITQDHLDYHKTRGEYIEAKSSIVKYQSVQDYAIINYDYEMSRAFSKLTRGKILETRTHGSEPEVGCFIDVNDNVVLKTEKINEKVIKFPELQLRGRHNLENVCAAVSAAYVAGSDLEIIKDSVRKFIGLEHRLEFIKEIDGVKFYNDSFSTTPETAIAALDSFEEPVVLIAGGSEKGSDYSQMGLKIAQKAKAVFLIGDMADKIEKSIPQGQNLKIYKGFTTMERLVREAVKLANSGDVVLLSPGCASFGLFNNYKERGQLFKKAVNEL